MSWTSMAKELNKLNPNLKPEYNFHYYSTHGVCLPNYYPQSTEDTSYLYSCIIMIINTICILIVAIAYCVIYWYIIKLYRSVFLLQALFRSSYNSLKNAGRSIQSNDLGQMQKKITLIIVTDFCCWLPITTSSICSLAGKLDKILTICTNIDSCN